MTTEEAREYKRQWRKKKSSDPEYKERRKAESKRYLEKHRDEINTKRRAKYANDPKQRDKVAQQNKNRWQQIKDDPELRADRNERHREWYSNLSDAEKQQRHQQQQEWLRANPERYAEYLLRKNKERRLRYHKQLDKAVTLCGGKCKICGLVDHPIIYDFHHRDPTTKSFTIAQYMGGVSWNKLESELLKCDMLCSHCHRKVTHGIL